MKSQSQMFWFMVRMIFQNIKHIPNVCFSLSTYLILLTVRITRTFWVTLVTTRNVHEFNSAHAELKTELKIMHFSFAVLESQLKQFELFMWIISKGKTMYC